MVEVYAGLDVSDKSTHVCVTALDGKVLWSGACATDPEVIAKTLRSRAPGLVRVILETGPLSAFLYHGLAERGVPVICVCARHAKGVLSVRVNKSDPHDAEGLAQMARTGWFKAVRIKQERPWSVRPGRGCGRLRRSGAQAQSIGRTRHQRPHLQGRRSHVALGPLRIRQQPAQPRQATLCAAGLGPAVG